MHYLHFFRTKGSLWTVEYALKYRLARLGHRSVNAMHMHSHTPEWVSCTTTFIAFGVPQASTKLHKQRRQFQLHVLLVSMKTMQFPHDFLVL